MNLNLSFSGGWSAVWSAWALRVGIYQYESQIVIFWGLICHLVCLTSQSRNLSVWISNCHFLGGGVICHLTCLCSQSRNLSVWISNWHFLGGRSAPWSAIWSAWALRVGIYQYQSQIALLKGGLISHLVCHLVCLSSQIEIYQYESQINISWGVDLPRDLPSGLPELSE